MAIEYPSLPALWASLMDAISGAESVIADPPVTSEGWGLLTNDLTGWAAIAIAGGTLTLTIDAIDDPIELECPAPEQTWAGYRAVALDGRWHRGHVWTFDPIIEFQLTDPRIAVILLRDTILDALWAPFIVALDGADVNLVVRKWALPGTGGLQGTGYSINLCRRDRMMTSDPQPTFVFQGVYPTYGYVMTGVAEVALDCVPIVWYDALIYSSATQAGADQPNTQAPSLSILQHEGTGSFIGAAEVSALNDLAEAVNEFAKDRSGAVTNSRGLGVIEVEGMEGTIPARIPTIGVALKRLAQAHVNLLGADSQVTAKNGSVVAIRKHVLVPGRK